MGADNDCIFLIETGKCALHHLVGDGSGEQNEKVGISDLIFQRGAHLCKDLGLAPIFLTQRFIAADHAIVSANNDDTHILNTPFLFICSLKLLLFMEKGNTENTAFPFLLFLRMTGIFHRAVRASASAGRFPLLFVFYHMDDDERADDENDSTDQNGSKILREPCKHENSLLPI